MVALWIGLALAQTPGVEVVPVAVASGGLLSADDAWLQTEQGCLKVPLQNGEVRVPRPVSAALGGKPFECVDQLRLSLTGWRGVISCTDFDHDDEGGPVQRWPSGRTSSLVVLDVERAVWREVFTLRARGLKPIHTVTQCTIASLASLRDEGIRAVGEDKLADWLQEEHDVWGTDKYCADYGEVEVQRSYPGTTGGIIVTANDKHAGEGDCRVACPVSDTVGQIDALNAQFEGKRYAHPDDASRALFATEALCLASELTNPYPPS